MARGACDEIRAATHRPTGAELVDAVTGAQADDLASWYPLIGALIWAGYASPASIAPVYDHVSAAWLNLPAPHEPIGDAPEAGLTAEFWQAFETAVAPDRDEQHDAGSITVATIMLGATVSDDHRRLVKDAATSHSGAAHALTAEIPPLISLAELASQPPGSLARELHAMWVDNDFDPEVLDREALGLAGLEPPLGYLNTRILQMHDVWHLMGGYDTTALGEVAISAFQLAQFGHSYSGMFLPFALTLAHQQAPQAAGIFMHMVAEAWQHGRRTTPFMAIEWEEQWQSPIPELRDRHGIEAFSPTWPQDLIEQMSPA